MSPRSPSNDLDLTTLLLSKWESLTAGLGPGLDSLDSFAPVLLKYGSGVYDLRVLEFGCGARGWTSGIDPGCRSRDLT